MKKAIFAFLCLSSLMAAGQNTRWDSLASTTTGVGQMLPVLALPGASIAFYTGCTTLPCVTPAVTYESASSGTACPSNAQVVWQLPIAQGCVGVADSQGNFGGWFLPGVYQYVITVSGHAAGPYEFNVGGSGGGVTSITAGTGIQVTGGTGAVTVSAAPNAYLVTTLSAGISSSATTIPLVSVAGLTPTGEIIIGSEWISYSGISGDNLTGATRGVHQTTAAAYSSGANVLSVVADFTNPTQPATSYILGNNGTLPTAPVFNCNAASLALNFSLQITCNTYFDPSGGIHQQYESTSNIFESEVGIGPGGGFAPITNSGYLFDSTRQNQSTVPQGFGAGIAGPVESIQPLTIAAPSIVNLANTGSTTWSYECTGTDVDGNTFPGTVASITNGPTTITSGEMIVSCPFSAGAYSETIWRTAGGPNQGAITIGTQPWSVEDGGISAAPGTPPATNSSVPKACVDSGEVSCWISTASAPTGSCTNGWFDTNQSGSPATLYQCVGGTWIEGTGSGGIASINGSTSSAQTLAASGTGLSVATVGSTTTYTLAGGAGTGAVQAGTQYQDVTYPSTGSTTTVGPLTNKYTVPTGLSTSQLNTLFSGLSNSTVAIQNGDGTTPFTNSNFDAVQDLRETYPVSDWNVKESGAQCDLQGGFGSVTSGSPTLTFTSGYQVSAADVGKYIEIVYEVSAVPTRFDATVTAVDVGADTATLSTNSPFTVSEYSVDIGHRDDAAIAAAFGKWTYHRPIAFPVGNCWSDTIAVYGQSFHGQGSLVSLVTGLAGDDVFAGLDPSQGGYQAMAAGMQIHDMRWEFDPRINASQPWQDVNASGTVTQHAGTYRPEGIFTVWANEPLGPGWIQGTAPNNTGATNGVASTTENSAVICIPTSETEPPVGQRIIFPYFASVFTSIVSSLTGAGCTGSTNPLTMAAALPNTSGYTTTQSEWMAGTNIQNIQTAIPSGTRSAVSITAYSITSNVVTLTATNSYSAGQIVNISGFGTSTFLNGAVLTVLSSGLSSSQFEADFTHANATATEAGSGSIFPFTLDLANNINPPLTPNVAGTGSNVAPYGLVQIDGEQFSYFSDSSYPATTSGTYWIKLTAGAQNGTSAASHSVNATIVPLNPFQPTWPWPVTPSLNSGVTPANAVYFPAWDIGNAAWSQPIYNGVDWTGFAALAFSDMHDITITVPDFFGGAGGGVEGGPNAFQQSNATAGMYIAASTFKAKFSSIRIIDPQFGIFEGTPSINVYGMFGDQYPTANGSSWDNITIQSAGYDTEFIEAQNDSKTNFLTFCQNGGETGTSWPGLPLGVVGCGAGWTESGTYDDKSGGGGSDNTNRHLDNWYIEAEFGSQEEMQPYFELNCGQCSYGGGFSLGGGIAFIEGSGNNFSGDQVQGQGALPIINYGTATTMQFVQKASLGGVSNTYGDGAALLNYGPNASASGHTDGNVGPFGAIAAGNNLAPVTGQTAEMFATGNDLGGPEYVSGNSALLFPDQLPLGDWVFDDTAPVSHSYAACALSPGQGCTSYQFNQNSRVVIGPDQKIAPGKYIVHYEFKGTVATSFYFELDAVNGGSGACSGGGTLLILNPSLTTSWVQGSAPIDFTNASTCDLQMTLHDSTLATTAEMGYLVFTPVPTTVMLPVNTPADNAACIPGAFLGSDSSYLYICTASGTVKRAVLATY